MVISLFFYSFFDECILAKIKFSKMAINFKGVICESF
jgi:hypothetical protein